MFGDDDEASEALAGVVSDEHGSQRFGDFGGMEARKVEVGEALRSRARSQRKAVFQCELPEGADTAAELGRDVGQGSPPDQVFVA